MHFLLPCWLERTAQPASQEGRYKTFWRTYFVLLFYVIIQRSVSLTWPTLNAITGVDNIIETPVSIRKYDLLASQATCCQMTTENISVLHIYKIDYLCLICYELFTWILFSANYISKLQFVSGFSPVRLERMNTLAHVPVLYIKSVRDCVFSMEML